MAMDATGIRRIYGLVQLSQSGDTFNVEAVRSVPYQSVSRMFFIGALVLTIVPRLRLRALPCTLAFKSFLKGY